MNLQPVKEFGKAGLYLLELCQEHDYVLLDYTNRSFVANLSSLKRQHHNMRRFHRLLPYAVSLIVLPTPLQIPIVKNDIITLLKIAGMREFSLTFAEPSERLLELGCSRVPEKAKEFIGSRLASKEFVEKLYPYKEHPGAVYKVNLVLHRLFLSMRHLGMGSRLLKIIMVTAGLLSNDQMINLILYGYALQTTYRYQAWDIALFYLLQPKEAKCVSNILKALGANSTREGAVLVEGDTLQGRAPHYFDLLEDAHYRLDPVLIKTKVLSAPDLLRQNIRAILKMELSGKNLELPDLRQWWTRRWAWCVNGSQTAASMRAMGLDPDSFKATHSRVYRRMAAESLSEEPLTKWDGVTTVSMSEKLENGKTRAIYACDTLNYFAFSWIISAAEEAWANKRVLLNPGLNGQVGIVRRIKNAQRGGGINLMLDYDDFNSHHSSETMAILFDELCEMFSAPRWYREKLISSFDNMYLHIEGRYQRVLGTLMSGHRGTAFINSILNAAYIRASVGGSYFDDLLSLHVGDDVYIRCNTLQDCENILTKTRGFGCRMNPTKQSVGFTGAEFLRMGIGDEAAYGYLARGVASFVAGNWLSEDLLNPIEGLQHAVAGCRTLINRSGSWSIGNLIAPALRFTRGLSIPTLKRMLRGEISLDGAPTFNQRDTVTTLKLNMPPLERIEIDRHWKHHACNDYMNNHCSMVEEAGLEMVRADAGTLMIIPSYQKGLNRVGIIANPKPTFTAMPPKIMRTLQDVEEVLKQPSREGCLSKYPLLQFVKNRLTKDNLRELVLMAGGDHNASDIELEAFGPPSVTRNILGALSYSDAAALSKKTIADHILVNFNVYL